MIIYDGVSIESVADVKIEDVRVSPIQFDEVTHPRAIRGGSDFVRSRAGTRTVAVTFALLDDDQINRQKKLDAISMWAKNDKEYKELIDKISLARNRNQQLTPEAMSMHSGSYCVLKDVFDGTLLFDKVQWKYGGEGKIPAKELAIFCGVVFAKLAQSARLEDFNNNSYIWDYICTSITDEMDDKFSLNRVELNSMYHQIKLCESVYSKLINALLDFTPEHPCRKSVFNSLYVVKRFPELWDALEENFWDYLEKVSNDEKYKKLYHDKNGVPRLNKNNEKTKFDYFELVAGSPKIPQKGIVAPLFVVLAYTHITFDYSTNTIIEKYSINELIDDIRNNNSELLEKLMEEYQILMDDLHYDPKEIGSNLSIYKSLVRKVENILDNNKE